MVNRANPFLRREAYVKVTQFHLIFFILCANVLSGLIHKEVQNKNVHGIKIARSAPQVSHLQFADDSLLFARAIQREASVVLKVLEIYQRASGQMGNMDKSKASFSRNVLEADSQIIYNMMGAKTVVSQNRYLGSCGFWEVKKGYLLFCEGSGLEEAKRVEGKMHV
jgi:hypothetical protein